MQLEVRIERLGAQGDGVADGPDGPLFVPFTLPGEQVSVAVEPGSDRAGLIEVLEPSPDRVAPICPHFGICGGCALQHLESDAYLAWKRELVVAALRSRGLEARGRGRAAGAARQPQARRARAWSGEGRDRSRLSPRPLARADRHRGLPGAHRRASSSACPGSNRRSRRCSAASARRG